MKISRRNLVNSLLVAVPAGAFLAYLVAWTTSKLEIHPILHLLAPLAIFATAVAWNRLPSRSPVGAEAVVGSSGVVVTDLTPIGEIRIGSEYWKAHSKTEPRIEAGARVTVVSISGLQVTVERSGAS